MSYIAVYICAACLRQKFAGVHFEGGCNHDASSDANNKICKHESDRSHGLNGINIAYGICKSENAVQYEQNSQGHVFNLSMAAQIAKALHNKCTPKDCSVKGNVLQVVGKNANASVDISRHNFFTKKLVL